MNGDSIFSNVLSMVTALDMVWLLIAPPVSHVLMALDEIQVTRKLSLNFVPSWHFCILVGLGKTL